MIALRSTSAIDNFVIVVHGLHDAKDFGWGLAMPMTEGATMKASYEVLQPLLELRNRGASGKDLDDFEKSYSYTNRSLNLVDAKFSQGSVARIVEKMRQLQRLKVRIVELRACTLGTNRSGLELVGQSFGARWVIALEVHMFYVSIDMLGGFSSGPTFDRLLKSKNHLATGGLGSRVVPSPRNVTGWAVNFRNSRIAFTSSSSASRRSFTPFRTPSFTIRPSRSVRFAIPANT
jgi:hypothetical protein